MATRKNGKWFVLVLVPAIVFVVFELLTDERTLDGEGGGLTTSTTTTTNVVGLPPSHSEVLVEPTTTTTTKPPTSLTRRATLQPTQSTTLSPTTTAKPTTTLTTASPSPMPTTTSSPTTIATSSPFISKNINLDRLKARFLGKRAIVTQTDNRLFSLLYQSGQPPANSNFTSNSYAVGPLSLQRWAHAQGLGYLFFSSPEKCPEPKSKSRLAAYWCKVPGMILATRIAKLCGVPYVMFLDSDVVPADTSIALEEIMSRMDEHPVAQFAVVPDYQHWSRLLHWHGDIYARALNSGAILIRVGETAMQMMDVWWNDLTGTQSPFELQMSRVTVHITVTQAKFWTEDNKLNSTMFESHMSNALVPSAKIQGSRAEKKPNVVFDLTPIPQFRTLFWEQTVGECCSEMNSTCFHAVNVLATPSTGIRCEKHFRNTLDGWPGDQDRLNWLQDQHQEAFVFEPLLSQGCNHATSNLKGMLFNHMCYSDNSKVYFSQVTGMQLMAHDMQNELRHRSWGDVKLEWEHHTGWATLKRELVSFSFESPANNKKPLETLLELIDQGNFMLTNV